MPAAGSEQWPSVLSRSEFNIALLGEQGVGKTMMASSLNAIGVVAAHGKTIHLNTVRATVRRSRIPEGDPDPAHCHAAQPCSPPETASLTSPAFVAAVGVPQRCRRVRAVTSPSWRRWHRSGVRSHQRPLLRACPALGRGRTSPDPLHPPRGDDAREQERPHPRA